MTVSKMPLPSVSSTDQAAFRQLNLAAYEQLVTFLEIAPEHLTIGFVAIDFQRDQGILLELLGQDERCQDLQLEVFCFDDPNLRFVQDRLRQELPQRSRTPGKKLIVFLTGLENSIGLYGDYPAVLQDLNFVRDGFTQSVPHPLVICVPDSALTRIARYAPDFWDWKRAVLEFQTLPSTREMAMADVTERQQTVAAQGRHSKEMQIESLLRLVTCPKNVELTWEMRRSHLQLWQQLGQLHTDLGQSELALETLQKALDLAKTVGTTIEQADILGDLASNGAGSRPPLSSQSSSWSGQC
jgi:hypothetical protein